MLNKDLNILSSLNLDVKPGQIATILGANGVGKSTSLKAIFGFLRPNGGTIRLDGADLMDVPAHKRILRGLAYIAQHPGIFRDMSVEENLLMGAWTFRRDTARIRLRLEANLPAFPSCVRNAGRTPVSCPAEIFRGGINAVDRGQGEAAAAVGMSGVQSMWHIILPQAVKKMLPAFINQSVIQVKNTSLLYTISIAELTYMTSVVNSETYRPLEAYTLAAVMYFAMLFPLTQAADMFERHMRRSD